MLVGGVGIRGIRWWCWLVVLVLLLVVLVGSIVVFWWYFGGIGVSGARVLVVSVGAIGFGWCF